MNRKDGSSRIISEQEISRAISDGVTKLIIVENVVYDVTNYIHRYTIQPTSQRNIIIIYQNYHYSYIIIELMSLFLLQASWRKCNPPESERTRCDRIVHSCWTFSVCQESYEINDYRDS